jgi:hypothetical protein
MVLKVAKIYPEGGQTTGTIFFKKTHRKIGLLLSLLNSEQKLNQ